MKMTVRVLGVALVGGGLVMAGGSPALGSDEFCPMGGTMIKVEVDKEKAADWVERERKKFTVADDPWTLVTLTDTSDDIALRLTEDAVFFGVGGKDVREVDERAAERAFGNKFRTLKEAVKKTMLELRKRDVVDIDGSDPQDLSDAAALGILEKSGRTWELKTERCEGVSIDVSDLN